MTIPMPVFDTAVRAIMPEYSRVYVLTSFHRSAYGGYNRFRIVLN
jgi:hypothetical protein